MAIRSTGITSERTPPARLLGVTDASTNAPALERFRSSGGPVAAALDDPRVRERLLALVAASDFLPRLLLSDPAAVQVLHDLDVRPGPAEDLDELVRWKERELLRIAARDLIGADDLDAVAANLARLADDVLRVTCSIVAPDADLAVIAMGKWGAGELNYASDIDVMFTGTAPDREARAIMDVARRCFHVDAALRPEGRDGRLVRSVDSFEEYWARWASPWEFQALLKARAVTGSPLAAAWERAADRHLWSRSFGADEIRSVREMKAHSERRVAEKGLSDREVKQGRGGIRDIEFSVQLLQLVHGRRDPELRVRSTVLALERLADGGYIAEPDARELTECYRFLRTVEHRLQLVEGQQTHTIPDDPGALARLAGTLGFSDEPGRTRAHAFTAALRRCQGVVRHAHERLYFRPLLGSFASNGGELSEAAETQLAAFGFTDASRTRQAVRELTKGLGRSSRLMQQLMPLVLGWLSDSPDPDQGLLGLRTVIASAHVRDRLVSVFRESPEAARRLCTLLGTSSLFASGVVRHPELLEDLDAERLLPPDDVADWLRDALEWRRDDTARHDALVRLTRQLLLRIAAADVLGHLDGVAAARARTHLAEAVLTTALADIGPPIRLAVIGMGRFGGGELSYVSDLDIIVVHEGSSAEDQLAVESVVQRLREYVGGSSPGRQLYPIDFDLRPEGRQGRIALSLDGCREYYGRWASTWERQAMLRARPVAGDADVAAAFMDLVRPFVWEPPIGQPELREIRQLKARMERERLPRSGDREYNLKLGPGTLSDVAWATQLLQLREHVPGTRTLAVLDDLVEQDAISAEDAAVLAESWRFCDRARNRWYLVNGAPGDALPADVRRLAVLARSLGEPELREAFRRTTRRARGVFERVFYGQPEG